MRFVGCRRFMRVISLLEDHPMHKLVAAVEAAGQRGTDDPAAIALLLRQGARPYQVVQPLSIDPTARGCERPIPTLDNYDVAALKENAR